MGLNKKAETQTAVAETQIGTAKVSNPAIESGSQAAIDRLKTTKTEAAPKAQYKQRDFDAEARGKTRCVQFEAALMSPAIAGMQFNTMEEYLKLVKQAADAGVAYSFQE